MTISFSLEGELLFCNPHEIKSTSLNISSSQFSYAVFFTSTIVIPSDAICVVDKTIFELYRDTITFPIDRLFLIDACEENKTLNTVTALIAFFNKQKLSKSSHVYIFGGGVTQEIAAFACAIYKRGIAYTHFPTTLLSMCDSCIGGKAGLNFEEAKNQLGVIYPPRKVIIFLDFLQTLPKKEIESGLGEILKSCLIGGDYFLSLYHDNIGADKVRSFQALIMAALCVKKAVVEKDEFEKNHRAILNYGHTVGHAIESFFNYTISHGQSIVLGMMLENYLSYQLGFLSESLTITVNKLCFRLIDQKIKCMLRDVTAQDLIHFMRKDKKIVDGRLRFFLPKKAGEFFLVALPIDSVFINGLQQGLSFLRDL